MLASSMMLGTAPMFAWLWIRMGRRGNEPGPVLKFAFGLLLVGAGFAVLIPPAYRAEAGALVGPGWLILTYLLHTWGELSLSPVGLSAMSKLAPVRIGGLVMGVWFLGTSVGNYAGGRAAGFYESMTIPNLFIAVTVFTVGAGLLFLLFSKPLNRLGADVQ